MVRIANEQRPVHLLDSIVDYLIKRGVADLSLRPLAKAVKSSPRVLLYYFGSKQDLIVKVLARLRERQQVSFDSMKSFAVLRPSDACFAIWKEMSSDNSVPFFRMFFEAYVMALKRPKSFSTFLRTSVNDWLEFIAKPLIRQGRPLKESRAYASVVLAGFRGFMLDYCATHDRKRLDQAVRLWVKALETISFVKEVSD
jgi:AcrR family transcriptional regulator